MTVPRFELTSQGQKFSRLPTEPQGLLIKWVATIQREVRVAAVTKSVFEGGFELLRPSVRGTPSPTTHSEGLLLRVGALPCCAPTYNCGMVQHVVFNRLGLAQPHECSSKAATCHANSTVQAPPTPFNNLYRGRNCSTTHVAKATDIFSGHDCVFLVE